MTAEVRRRVRSGLGWLLVAIVIYLAWPAQLGGNLSLVVVSGHSMDGTYRTGDLLLAWPETDYAVGDVIVYKIPNGEPASGLRVVHRVIDKQSGHFTTQGDNRNSPDFWRPTTQNVVGTPFLRIRAGGLALKWLLSPIALAMLCGGCVYWAVVGTDEKDVEAEESEPQDDEATDDDETAGDEPSGELTAGELESVAVH